MSSPYLNTDPREVVKAVHERTLRTLKNARTDIEVFGSALPPATGEHVGTVLQSLDRMIRQLEAEVRG